MNQAAADLRADESSGVVVNCEPVGTDLPQGRAVQLRHADLEQDLLRARNMDQVNDDRPHHDALDAWGQSRFGCNGCWGGSRRNRLPFSRLTWRGYRLRGPGCRQQWRPQRSRHFRQGYFRELVNSYRFQVSVDCLDDADGLSGITGLAFHDHVVA